MSETNSSRKHEASPQAEATDQYRRTLRDLVNFDSSFYNLDLLLVFCFGWYMFSFMVDGGQGDIRSHNRMAIGLLTGKAWPGHCLYHLLVVSCAGFSSDPGAIAFASTIVPSGALTAKYVLARDFLEFSPIDTDHLR